MSDYLKSQAEQAAKFSAAIAAIAKELASVIGGTAQYHQKEHGYNTILLDGGRSIHFSKEWNKNRANVSGNWPRDNRGEVFSPYSGQKTNYSSISVSLDRSPEAAAKDIARRFIPGYLEEYNNQLQRAQGSNKYITDTNESICLAAKCLGLPAPAENQSRSRGVSPSLSIHLGEACWGNVEASGESLSLKISNLTREHAKAILDLITKLNTK